MKKILPLLLVLISIVAITKKSVAATNTISAITTDTVRKKIVHPKDAMTDEQVTDILNNMRQKRNDEEKVTALKEGVKDKGIKIDQLIKLLNQFLTDDSKIACAEYAFPYTVDHKAFLKIMDLFGTEGYKYKLEDFYDKNRK
jgi:hypothetical protein